MEQPTSNTIYMPEPTEENVMTFEQRSIAFPNGLNLTLRMCRWHWDMIAFFDQWNEHYQREQGTLYELYKATSGTPAIGSFEREFSDSVMVHLRDVYEESHKGLPPGERKPFNSP
jgi:hypothetical protein